MCFCGRVNYCARWLGGVHKCACFRVQKCKHIQTHLLTYTYTQNTLKPTQTHSHTYIHAQTTQTRAHACERTRTHYQYQHLTSLHRKESKLLLHTLFVRQSEEETLHSILHNSFCALLLSAAHSMCDKLLLIFKKRIIRVVSDTHTVNNVHAFASLVQSKISVNFCRTQ